jgi:hypothetical protein
VGFYGLPFVTRHRDWLICALLILLLITGISFLDPTIRSLFHYSALALLCLPVLGIAVRSDVFRSGGFRLYTVYFLWAACTIPYSLAPEFSLARLSEAFLTLAAPAAIVVDVREADGPTRLLSHILVAAGIILVRLVEHRLVGFALHRPKSIHSAHVMNTIHITSVSAALLVASYRPPGLGLISREAAPASTRRLISRSRPLVQGSSLSPLERP